MRPRSFFSITVLVILTIFILQNFAQVTVSFLMWEVTLPRSIVLLVVFAIGMLAGILIRKRNPD